MMTSRIRREIQPCISVRRDEHVKRPDLGGCDRADGDR